MVDTVLLVLKPKVIANNVAKNTTSTLFELPAVESAHQPSAS